MGLTGPRALSVGFGSILVLSCPGLRLLELRQVRSKIVEDDRDAAFSRWMLNEIRRRTSNISLLCDLRRPKNNEFFWGGSDDKSMILFSPTSSKTRDGFSFRLLFLDAFEPLLES